MAQDSDSHVVTVQPSLEALKTYSMAVKTEAERGPNAAVPFFRRAIEIDPKFAVAYAELGVTYGDLAQASLAAENLKKAYELRTDRESS